MKPAHRLALLLVAGLLVVSQYGAALPIGKTTTPQPIQAVVFEESADRAEYLSRLPDYVQTITGPEAIAWAAAANQPRVRVVDVSSVPPEFATTWAAVKSVKLPAAAVVSKQSGKILWSGPMPAKSEWLATLKKYGGG